MLKISDSLSFKIGKENAYLRYKNIDFDKLYIYTL